VVFGLPGDGINGFMEALRTHQEKIRLIQVRHEEGAAFAACGYAKFSGRLGVCIATSGPGAIHLLNTLLGAARDAAPVYGSGGFTSYSIGQLKEQCALPIRTRW
jgi:thiamine pyrophosphate-dependent acetolactate synthase large subunit-like protein